MKLSADTKHLLERRLKAALQPGQIVLTALLTTIVFAFTYLALASKIRYSDSSLSMLLVLCFVALCAAMTYGARTRYKNKRPARGWIAVSVCGWAAIVAGYIIGERAWYTYTAQYFVYSKMASYVNVDPNLDKGRSYMDAGVIYFKHSSYVDTSKAVAFHNGLTYCVAPIMRSNLSGVVPSVDFWAVGTDCCGDSGAQFSCGDTGTKARSGLRLLDDTSRAMYLLGVQEWSATAGVRVEHPVFFRWTRDPITYREETYNLGWSNFWFYVTICFVTSFVTTFMIHSFLRRARVV
jgi:magnesium-transporting ATPase (P-type)